MKKVIEELQVAYIDFDKCTIQYTHEQKASLLSNRAFYIKHKITNGTYSKEYDLSDYVEQAQHTTQTKEQPTNGAYQYTFKQ